MPASKASIASARVKALAAKIDALPGADEGAESLIEMDLRIQKVTKKIDKMLEASLGKLPKRIVEATDISCHAKSSAIPVDLAMRALQFGVLKIAFSVLPRMLQQFVKAEVYEVAERGLAYFAGKRALQKIPAVGTILGIIIGGLHSVDYNRTLERRIRGVLGCKASQSDIVPMRKQINDLVTKMKERKAKQPRPSGPVRTRHK